MGPADTGERGRKECGGKGGRGGRGDKEEPEVFLVRAENAKRGKEAASRPGEEMERSGGKERDKPAGLEVS